MIKSYGIELILDLHNCNPETFNRESIEDYLIQLCELIDMEKEDIHFWDYKGFPEEYNDAPNHLKGTSVVQFIKTSTIVIHTLDILCKVFINVFSCKEFDCDTVSSFSKDWFKGKIVNKSFMKRL